MRWKCPTIRSALLREVWRVLAPSGRLMAVIPNRRGVWTRIDTTPFGHGRPYSRSQITQLLRRPGSRRRLGRGAVRAAGRSAAGSCARPMAWERVGADAVAPFAGVHIVEATKQVYRAIPARPRTHAADSVAGAGAGAVVDGDTG